jgi:hypothetical protein
MKKSFKLFLAAAFLVTEFFVVALPLMVLVVELTLLLE